MKEFFKVLKRFVPPYKKYLLLSLLFTFLSAILNVFSFMVIIPILQVLFKITDASGVTFTPWSEVTSDNFKEATAVHRLQSSLCAPVSCVICVQRYMTRLSACLSAFSQKSARATSSRV